MRLPRDVNMCVCVCVCVDASWHLLHGARADDARAWSRSVFNRCHASVAGRTTQVLESWGDESRGRRTLQGTQ